MRTIQHAALIALAAMAASTLATAATTAWVCYNHNTAEREAVRTADMTAANTADDFILWSRQMGRV